MSPGGPAWVARSELGQDVPAIRTVVQAAFPTGEEADLVDALRADPAWIPELSIVTTTPDGQVVGHALLTGCQVGEVPALCLAPCAVLPEFQGQGAGSAAIGAALAAARARALAGAPQDCVVVLGHPGYYPRFGFTPASHAGIAIGIPVPDEVLQAMSLTGRDLPAGEIRYAAPFGL